MNYDCSTHVTRFSLEESKILICSVCISFIMGYPKHWKELAKAIKKKANWCCQKCVSYGALRYRLLPPDQPKESRTYLQVHHWNRDPSDNRLENLVALCPKLCRIHVVETLM